MMYLVEFDDGEMETAETVEQAMKIAKARQNQAYDYPINGVVYECKPVYDFSTTIEFTLVKEEADPNAPVAYATGKELFL